MNLAIHCGFPYVGRSIPSPLTRTNMAQHSRESCEDTGNAARRILMIDECECPCHEGDERALSSSNINSETGEK